MINVSRCGDDPAAFATADGALRAAVTAFGARGEAELAAPDLHPAPRKVLESLGNHWTGLTVFVEHPEVPMDNNTAERSERGPVVGRKNGSSVFKCKTSRIGPSGPWPSGGCARSSSRSLATPDSSPGSIGPTDSSLTSVHRYAW